MKRIILLAVMALTLGLASQAQDFKTYENKAFSIDYPADWEVTWDSETFMNLANEDESIRFDISYNEEGPTKEQLQQCVDNWVYMKESKGYEIDQKLVKEDYALVRSIEPNEEDDTLKTVVVWFIMISNEPECFCGTIQSDLEHANEALDALVNMLSTLNPK